MSDFVPDFGAVKSVIVEDFDGSALRSFKDCHQGERCFILGNGPSLKRTDLAPLADEITIGVNGIFYMTQQCGFAPTYYVVEDNHVFSDDLVRVNNVDAVAKFFPSKYRPIITPGPDVHFLPTDWSFYWGSSPWYETPRFSHDVADVIYVGQTVTFLNIQLAAYMGFSEIYLVGVDFDYQIPEAAKIEGLTITSVDDDPNHFHPDYFGKGKKWHLPKLDNVEKAMLCAQEGVKERGGTIFNATVGGKLEAFPRGRLSRPARTAGDLGPERSGPLHVDAGARAGGHAGSRDGVHRPVDGDSTGDGGCRRVAVACGGRRRRRRRRCRLVPARERSGNVGRRTLRAPRGRRWRRCRPDGRMVRAVDRRSARDAPGGVLVAIGARAES